MFVAVNTIQNLLEGITMAEKIVVKSLFWVNTEDTYEQGEIGRGQVILSERNIGIFDTVAEMVKEISSRFGISDNMENWAIFEQETEGDEGRIDAQMMVNDRNYEPSEQEFSEWKAGARTLWSAHITIVFQLVVVKPIEAGAMAEKFGLQLV